MKTCRSFLPEDAEFLPTGESPLKHHKDFLHTTCPKCHGPAERETYTMDTFLCSSWYQYAYLSLRIMRGRSCLIRKRPPTAAGAPVYRRWNTPACT